MRIEEYLQHIKEQLKKPLPGDAAHKKMASYPRPPVQEVLQGNKKPKRAGVLIALFESNGELHCSLIQRPTYNGTHSGQIAFPGGQVEKNDVNIVDTALREAEEEVGINRNDVEILGSLSELYIPPSNFLVYPVVGYLPHIPNYRIDPVEVALAFHFPLSFMKQEDAVVKKSIFIKRYGVKINAPSYFYQGKTIWGATAMMLSELNELLPLSD